MDKRRNFQSEIKSKFSDVFEVSADCGKFPADLDLYDDTVNVVGRLKLPSSISFFEEIGASDFVLNIMKETLRQSCAIS